MDESQKEYPQALFLDRDGTLIKWVHYLSNPEEVELVEGVQEALFSAKRSGCLLFLHTNQSGVGRGYFGMDAVDAVNVRMCESMGVGMDFFDGVCVAPDHPEEAGEGSYRKPSPRFELEMAERFGLSLGRCYMLGDSLSDVWTGLNAGMRPVLVRSGQRFDGALPPGVFDCDSVSEFWGRFERGEVAGE